MCNKVLNEKAWEPFEGQPMDTGAELLLYGSD